MLRCLVYGLSAGPCGSPPSGEAFCPQYLSTDECVGTTPTPPPFPLLSDDGGGGERYERTGKKLSSVGGCVKETSVRSNTDEDTGLHGCSGRKGPSTLFSRSTGPTRHCPPADGLASFGFFPFGPLSPSTLHHPPCLSFIWSSRSYHCWSHTTHFWSSIVC